MDLFLAAQFGNIPRIRELLAEGVDVNGKDSEGMTSLMYASRDADRHHSIEAVKLLIENGANVNAKGTSGWTSLMMASMTASMTADRHAIEAIKLLLKNGADINAKNNMGFTSLMIASSLIDTTSSIEIVKLLLENGADPFIKNDENKTALDLCPTDECRDVISLSIATPKWNKIRENDLSLINNLNKTTPVLSKNIWNLILLRKHQQELCKNLSDNKNKYLLMKMAEFLEIPFTFDSTKKELCNLISINLSQK